MKDNSHQDSDAICPTFAVSYKVSDNVTVYADHTESFGTGTWYLLAEVMRTKAKCLILQRPNKMKSA